MVIFRASVPLNVGILYYNAVVRADLETHSLGWPRERIACESRGTKLGNLHTNRRTKKRGCTRGAFRVLHEQIEPNRQGRHCCCHCATREGGRDGLGEEVRPDQASECCTNKANDIISSSDLSDATLSVRLSVRRSDPFPLLSSPSAAPFRSLAPLRFPLFPAPLNAQHAVCPERQRKGKWKAAARAVA